MVLTITVLCQCLEYFRVIHIKSVGDSDWNTLRCSLLVVPSLLDQCTPSDNKEGLRSSTTSASHKHFG